jgi:hypothetical protein
MPYEQLYPFPPFEEPKPEEKKEIQPDRPQTMRRVLGSRAAQALLGAALVLSDPHEAEAKKPGSHATQHEDRSSSAAAKKRKIRLDTENVIPTKRVSLDSREDNGIVREIEAGKRMNLEHYHTEADLKEALEAGKLVDITPDETDGYEIDPGLGELAKPESRYLYRTLLAEVAERLSNLAGKYYQKFHEKLHISSAIRTDAYVIALRKINPNTAKGFTSTHLLGTTVDIVYAKHRKEYDYRMTEAQMKWLSSELLKLETAGKVFATKERAQPCFHVMFVPEDVKESEVIDLDK